MSKLGLFCDKFSTISNLIYHHSAHIGATVCNLSEGQKNKVARGEMMHTMMELFENPCGKKTDRCHIHFSAEFSRER